MPSGRFVLCMSTKLRSYRIYLKHRSTHPKQSAFKKCQSDYQETSADSFAERYVRSIERNAQQVSKRGRVMQMEHFLDGSCWFCCSSKCGCSGMLSEMKVPFRPTCERFLQRHVQSPTRQIHGFRHYQRNEGHGLYSEKDLFNKYYCITKLKTSRLVIKSIRTT